jgi:hypothetical protein
MVSMLFFSVYCSLPGQDVTGQGPGAVDTDLTVVGRDDAVIPIPLPWQEREIPIPEFDPGPVPAQVVPAIQPPTGAGSFPLASPPVPDPLQEPSS